MPKSLEVVLIRDLSTPAEIWLDGWGETVTVRAVASGEAARAALAAQPGDALLMVDAPPAVDGVEIIAQLRAAGVTLPLIGLAGAADEDRAGAALRAGATDWLTEAQAARLPLVLAREANAAETLRQAEAARQFVEALHSALLETSTEAVLLKGPAGEILDANAIARDLFGYSHAELLTLKLADLLPTEAQSGLAHWLTEAVPDQQVFLDTFARRKDGSLFAAEISARHVRPGPARLDLLCLRDITPRQQTERALQLFEIKYSLLTSNAYDWDLWLAPDGHVIYASPSCLKLIGYAAEAFEAEAGLLARLVHPEDRALFERHLPSERQGQAGELELRLCHANGQVRWVSHVCQPLFSAREEFLGTHVGHRDITEYKQTEAALRESEARYRRLLESVTNYVYTVEVRNGRPFSTTHGPACVVVTGYAAEEYAANPLLWYAMVADDDKPAVLDQATRVLAGGGPSQLEHRIVCKDGSIRWVRNTSVPHYNSQGELIAYEGLVTDITERKRAEETLRESEMRYRALFEQASDAIFLETLDDRILDANPRACELLGYSRDQLLALTVSDLLAPEVRALGAGVLLRELELYGNRPFEGVNQHQAGRLIPVEVANTRLSYMGGSMVMAIVRDISERKRAEESLQRARDELERRVQERTVALRSANVRLRQLARQVVKTQEEERRHLARELHDEAGQMLTGLKFTLEMTEKRSVAEARAGLQQALAMVSELIRRIRSLSLDLRPAMLDDLGLVAALLWLFERYTAQTKVRVHFEHAGLETRFTPEVETAAYRIVQEGLTNVARYASVQEATVRLWVDQEVLIVQIEDEGKGFDLEADWVDGASAGLTGMRERALLLEGQLTIETARGAGTRLIAELPLTGRNERKVDDDHYHPLGG